MRQTLELALEALETTWYHVGTFCPTDEAIELYDEAKGAIKEALAQPEQEPVGKFAKFTDGVWREVTDGSAGVPLYTHPPQRTWVGLTDEELEQLSNKWRIIYDGHLNTVFACRSVFEMVEAKLKEKNT